MVLATRPSISVSAHRILEGIVIAVWVYITAEFITRLWRWRSSTNQKRRVYLASSNGFIDLAATLALPIGWLVAPDPKDVLLFAIVWSLRFARHGAGLALFGRVMRRSRVALLTIANLFLLIFLSTATLAYIFERGAQPEAFGSVPRAMWWAIVTLTTTGYGHVIPVTIWGRLLAGWVMVGGIVMFALQAGIIATAFAEELKRRHFLNTWDLVTAVSFFQDMGAAAIADIVRLLQPIHVAKGATIVRQGGPGNSMYFIVSGEVAVRLTPEPVVLGEGSFFGEMALLFDAPRSATVIATKPSVLLVLDIADFRVLAGRRPEIVEAIEAEGKRRREANITMEFA